jgi:hypothetical protein
VSCAGLQTASLRCRAAVSENAEFRSFFENAGRHAVLRATQSPMACVYWVGHGTGRLYALLVRVQSVLPGALQS